ncbi:MAG: ATPase [Microbacterium sp.]|nr:ATPase [Microbacterium sp.]
MKNVVWFMLGVAGGFVVAHFMDKDPRGHEVLADIDARISEFTDRIGDAYREQEARISGVIADAQDAAGEAIDATKDAASRAVDAAAEAAHKLTD